MAEDNVATKPTETQEIQKTEAQKPAPLISIDEGDFQCYLDTAKFNQMWRAAQVFSSSEIVPTQYRNKPNDCFIALQMAMRCKCDPMAFMQGTYVVYGRPGMEAKLAIALMNSRGPFDGPVQWKFEGKGASRSCTAYAKHKQTGGMCEATITWDMAEKEGWTKKQGSKWQTMPDLMFMYRSAAFLGRLYCPEVLYGMQTVEEIVDVGPRPEDTNIVAIQAPQAGNAAVAEKLTQRKKVESTEQKPAEEKKDKLPVPDVNELRAKWICDVCGRLVVELKKNDKGKAVCPYADCLAVGEVRETTDKDFEPAK